MQNASRNAPNYQISPVRILMRTDITNSIQFNFRKHNLFIHCDIYHFVSKNKHCDINDNESRAEKTPFGKQGVREVP